MRVAIIGCGNMGMAYAKSFLQNNLVKPDNMLLVAKNPARHTELAGRQAGRVVLGITEQVGQYDLVIVAVKPQDFSGVAQELREVVQPQQMVLSIMAGIPIARLQQELAHPLIIRAMPNTPALIGLGMTAYAAADGLTVQQIRQVENLINSTGRAVFLEQENLLDAATAVSGSGPAYFFYIVRAMIEAGRQLGFDEALAAQLVKQTMLGSFHLLNNSEKSLDELIKAVASKGGTTEAALTVFGERDLTGALIGGISAAERRAGELSKG
ncbi:pyrroline-5-carboxylate reductase [Hymenobacter aerilatus]|uniref:Pyrroline-5-carboxylate reductase n=1 Tax=Hymenobacter aerilatus TaxID=2932251 RepID=A0A8T9SX50_9BACT|nr:pyrroline-5-carboxylate reductase [Hymenobacter aerilatus]UOR06415.1 pyrroline-5-carboxylate reductase [Hymenobacter aerilatus]